MKFLFIRILVVLSQVPLPPTGSYDEGVSWLKLCDLMGENVVSVRGNHDDWTIVLLCKTMTKGK